MSVLAVAWRARGAANSASSLSRVRVCAAPMVYRGVGVRPARPSGNASGSPRARVDARRLGGSPRDASPGPGVSITVSPRGGGGVIIGAV
jgi:hypothetical protein